jgi:hypothetical protein
MATAKTSTEETRQGESVANLRKRLLSGKAARRRYLTTAPISEKLKILEEMRDTTRALKTVREQNRSRIRETISNRSIKSP